MQSYDDINSLFRGVLKEVLQNGKHVEVRGLKTKEIHPALLHLKNPESRVLTVPGRKNNIFATLAEYIWIMSGRNDLRFLSYYLPNAKDYSDDGETWRAGYGPRIRNWHGKVDQIREVVKSLQKDLYSRRAVISIFDPSEDFVDGSKDYPCTNWLHFMVRDNKLDLKVTMRSNDVFYGMSQTNIPVFTMIQSTVASLLNIDVGSYYHDADSLHIYEDLIPRAEQITKSLDTFNIYSLPVTELLVRDIKNLDSLDEDLQFILWLENEFRKSDPTDENNRRLLTSRIHDIKSVFLMDIAKMLISFVLAKTLRLPNAIKLVNEVDTEALRIAGLEYLWRTKVSKLEEDQQHALKQSIHRDIVQMMTNRVFAPGLCADSIIGYIVNG